MLGWIYNQQNQVQQNIGPYAGSIVNVWIKDPTMLNVGQNGITQLFLQGNIQHGPATNNIVMAGVPKVAADNNQNFLFAPQENQNEFDPYFDTVNAFSYVHRTLEVYRRVVNDDSLTWQWGQNTPIEVHPNAGVMENAFYSRQGKCLKFFHFQSQTNPGETIYDCREQGVVAHETGHAILDSLRPGYLESYLPQTGAMHEAFGDISSIVVLLEDLRVCEQVITQSKGNLKAEGLFLPDLANQFGMAIGLHNGLRNANNDITLAKAGTEVHALSRVFTGAMYDILNYLMHYNRDNNKKYSLSETLHHTANDLIKLMVQAMRNGPSHNASFADVANHMIALTPDPQVKAIISHCFSSRGVDLQKRVEVSLQDIKNANYDKCSRTLNTHEVKRLRNTAIKNYEQKLEADKHSWVPNALRRT